MTTDNMNFNQHSHRRYNPLLGEWILVSPHRTQRPWQGAQDQPTEAPRLQHDPSCYLCPGNTRAGGIQNPNYPAQFIFINDYSAIMPDTPAAETNDNLFKAKSERGICKVICFSPRHDLTLAELQQPEIEQVIKLWQQEYSELGQHEFINHVQIFENKGSLMGCSNPHPHGQIWAQESIPDETKKENIQQQNYWREHKSNLLEDYAAEELRQKKRIVHENDYFVALVPFWAIWPFETMILPKKAQPNILALDQKAIAGFADILKRTTVKYDNLFNVSFPYSAGIHQSPTNNGDYPHWCWHMHFYPPLLRSATIKKFMVGYEMLGEPQRDITPEQSADILRKLSSTHYKTGK